jgi:hypothetical protein
MLFLHQLRTGLGVIVASGLAATGLAIVSTPQSSQAAPLEKSVSLQSSSGQTRLLVRIREGEPVSKWQIDYQTKLGGEIWSGNATPLRINGHDGERSILGTFKDWPGRNGFPSNDDRYCTGDFTLTQRFQGDRAVADVTWHVTGGKNCEAIGQKIRIKAAETLPVANSEGDFTYGNVRTWLGLDAGQNDFRSWERWQVVDQSDTLNCRQWPNGKIVKTYQRGDRFASQANGRGIANAILGSDNGKKHPSQLIEREIKGDPWLETTDRCYVRANSQYIRPLSGLEK